MVPEVKSLCMPSGKSEAGYELEGEWEEEGLRSAPSPPANVGAKGSRELESPLDERGLRSEEEVAVVRWGWEPPLLVPVPRSVAPPTADDELESGEVAPVLAPLPWRDRSFASSCCIRAWRSCVLLRALPLS